MAMKDGNKWGPTENVYSIKLGYVIKIESMNLPPRLGFWNFFRGNSLPKVRIFSWILSQGKALTVENLL